MCEFPFECWGCWISDIRPPHGGLRPPSGLGFASAGMCAGGDNRRAPLEDAQDNHTPQ